MLSLVHLPPELLVEILCHLDCAGLLGVRQTCHKLHEVSKQRSVWVRVYENVAKTDITRLLWLEKPLDLYDSSELEDAVSRLRAAELGWVTDTTEPVVKRVIKPGGQIRRLLLVPGGRWVIAVCDRHIDYCDLDEDLPVWRLLVPDAPVPANGFLHHCIIKNVQLDQEIRMQPSISQFNIAVACESEDFIQPMTFIQIWRVSSVIEGRSVIGLTAMVLKCFGDPVNSRIFGQLSFCGSHVLYSLWPSRRHHTFIVVCWTKVIGGTAYHRQCFQTMNRDHGYRAYLLPNERLMLLYPGFCEFFDFSSVPEDPRYFNEHFLSFSTSVILRHMSSYHHINPLMVFGEEQIRLIVPSYSSVHALVFKTGDSISSGSNQVEQMKILGRPITGCHVLRFGYGCYRGFEIEKSGEVHLVSYKQPADENSKPESRESVIRYVSCLSKCLKMDAGFDEGSGRVVVVTEGGDIVALNFGLQYKWHSV